MIFSIIVVCLNAGEKLRATIESILSQTERDYEVIIKDGGSTDEITRLCLSNYGGRAQTDLAQVDAHLVRDKEHSGSDSPHSGQIRVYCNKDAGIYDAMNQAMQYVQGDYVLFLNCGDRFYDNEVLAQAREQIARIREQSLHVQEQISQVGMQSDQKVSESAELLSESYIFYGNIHECQTDTFVQSNPVIDDFACYRNVPCHQACFYAAELLRRKPFDTAYAVRADYEHFLWCYFKGHAKTVYMPITVALYEGGGFSETKENAKKSRQEHRKVTSIYMPASKIRKYRLAMIITLAPLRTWVAGNPVTAGIYQAIKRKLYQR